jgi:antitoxin component YwqK of YwqJK toxin-antitoxin module
MKYVSLIFALLFVVVSNAQDTAPKFEIEGHLVKATFYHDNGEIAQTGYFLNEKLHGKWKMYNTEGKKIAMGEFNNGKRTGKWFFWNADALNVVDFKDSRLAGVITWKDSNPVVLNK